uniref:Uncharacterized protein n=1 Tax=Molossus molossus TaxID=27622 RepID=A0A7J8JW09_MOLMO|nr:hypothetical protein HJG59_007961 [Molossus molossus]
MGNILSCCWKRSASPSASPNASPNASPSPVLHSVLVNQVVDELNVCVPSTRISVAVPPTIAALEYGDLDDLDFDVGQPVWRMSDIKMPTGKEALGVLCSQANLWPPLLPGSPRGEPPPQAPSCLEPAFQELALHGIPTSYSFLYMCGQFLFLFTTQMLRFFFYSYFISQPKTVLLKALLISVGLYEFVTYPYGT